MKAQQQGQGQDHRQWQDAELAEEVELAMLAKAREAEYSTWAKAREAEDEGKFEAWIETKEGTAWISKVCRKEWTLDEFIASPEGISWIEGNLEQIAGPSWID